MTEQSEQEREQFAQFEKDGEERVRLNLKNYRYPHAAEALAIRWLAPKNEAAAQRREALDTEQIELARRTTRSAKEANTIAWIALAVAVAALVLSIFLAIRGHGAA
ncbi:hypothetical protein [Methylocella sp.]|jgi:hypothetical protein|uniref:hypothetical protein n=1 Tax=Methylocella sp. TaxID=1978226 RepID=UPI003C1BBA1B